MSFALSLVTGLIASYEYAPTIILIVVSAWLFVLWNYVWGKRDVIWTGILLGIFSAVVCLPIAYVKFVLDVVWQFHSSSRMEQLNPFQLSGVQFLFVAGFPWIFSFFASACQSPFLIL
jgi:hypothetical protein